MLYYLDIHIILLKLCVNWYNGHTLSGCLLEKNSPAFEIPAMVQTVQCPWVSEDQNCPPKEYHHRQVLPIKIK